MEQAVPRMPDRQRAFLVSIIIELMNRSIRAFLVALLLVVSTSCIQNSTVVRVHKDGQGEIFVRYAFSPQLIGMLKSGALPGGLGGEAGGKATDPTTPDEAMLKAQAAVMGEGVKYLGYQKETTKAGWDGFVAVYSFSDINKVGVMPGDSKQLSRVLGQGGDGGSTETPMTFSYAEGTLRIKIPETINNAEAIARKMGESQGSQQKLTPEQLDAALPMMGAMMSGLRIAVFVRMDGELASTNASHAEGSLITITDTDIGEMIKDPSFIQVMKSSMMDKKPAASEVEKMMSDLSKAKGFKMETKSEVSATFK